MKTAYECWDMAGRDPSVPIVIDDTGVGGVSDRLQGAWCQKYSGQLRVLSETKTSSPA